MREFKSCMGTLSSPLDPRERYSVVGQGVQTLKKPEGITFFLKQWRHVDTFKFDRDTKVVMCKTRDNGSGRIKLKNKGGKDGNFFIYQEFSEFFDELSYQGLRVDNTSY